MPAWQCQSFGIHESSCLGPRVVFIHGEETWQGLGKCFPSPGGPSGWVGYLHYLSFPDYASIPPSSPFWLCRICLCDTKRKSSVPTNAICAIFSLHVWIWSLGNLYIHSKVNVTLVGGMWHLCLTLETSPCCLLGGKQQFITDQFIRMSVVSSWGMVEEGTGRRTREGIHGSLFLFLICQVEVSHCEGGAVGRSPSWCSS